MIRHDISTFVHPSLLLLMCRPNSGRKTELGRKDHSAPSILCRMVLPKKKSRFPLSWARLHWVHLLLHVRRKHLLPLRRIIHVVPARNVGYLSSVTRWHRLLLPGLHMHLGRRIVAYVCLHRVYAVSTRVLYLLALHGLSIFVSDTAAHRRHAGNIVGRVPVACGCWRFYRRINLLFQYQLSRNLHRLWSGHAIDLRQRFLQMDQVFLQHVQETLLCKWLR
jgi:hypothetical protein